MIAVAYKDDCYDQLVRMNNWLIENIGEPGTDTWMLDQQPLYNADVLFASDKWATIFALTEFAYYD